MDYRCVFFDLDGTLTDSGPGIFASLKHVFDSYGVDDSDLNYNEFAGPPLSFSIGKVISNDAKTIDDATKMYRTHYSENGLLKNNRVYDGIVETLEFLTKNGCKLGLVTSKPEYGTMRVISHFDLEKYFDGIFCPKDVNNNMEKYENLMEALNTFKCDSSQALMVGDRMYDLIAAQKAGVDAIGVLYGYGSREELESYPHIFLANEPLDIKKIIS